MKKIINQLENEQSQLITNLLKLAVTFEKTKSAKNRRNVKSRSKTVRKNLLLNESILQRYGYSTN